MPSTSTVPFTTNCPSTTLVPLRRLTACSNRCAHAGSPSSTTAVASSTVSGSRTTSWRARVVRPEPGGPETSTGAGTKALGYVRVADGSSRGSTWSSAPRRAPDTAVTATRTCCPESSTRSSVLEPPARATGASAARPRSIATSVGLSRSRAAWLESTRSSPAATTAR